MFSDAVNRPVLRVPGRRFPGVVIQGDTLSGLVTNAEALLRVLTEANLPAADDAEELSTKLNGLLEHYAETLTENGIPLPYVMSSAAPADQRLHVAGWVHERDGRRFLELASSFVDYDFDDNDWLAISAQLEQEAHHSAHYLMSGSFDLAVDLALTDDGGHLSLDLSGGPNRHLQIQLETLFTALTHPDAPEL